jgi:antitoxin component YwqK of YwqJK toxin-antitoxin module
MANEPTEAIDRYPNDNVRFKGFHLDGEMHGEWTFYRADGSLMRTGAFDRGRQVGVWRTFKRDGELAKETDFGR